MKLINPMLCHGAGLEKIAETDSDPSWGLGEKFDGFRELMYIDSLGRIRMFARSGAEHTANVPHLTSIVVPELADTVLDGEGIGPSNRIESTKSIFGSKPGYAIAWQEKNGKARYIAFDILRFKGKDITSLPLDSRRGFLISVVAMLQESGMEAIYPEILHKSNKVRHFRDILSRGGEGAILKDLYSHYSPGKRTKAWLKIKPVLTWDVVIMGFTAGRGKYKSMVGAIRYGLYREPAWPLKEGNFRSLAEVGKCSGMTDEQRQEFTDDPNSYVGLVIEVAGQDVGKDGAIRFPRFKQFRSDKLPQECLLS